MDGIKLFSKKFNYTRMTPLVWVCIFCSAIFGTHTVTLLINNSNLWWIIFFGILMVVPVLLFIVIYIISFIWRPDFLDTEYFRLMNRKYDIISEKGGKINLQPLDVNLNDNEI